MAIFSMQDLRAQAPSSLQGLSDEGLLQAFASKTGKDPMQVAEYLGYDGGKSSLTNERMSASADNYQANLYGVGEAVTGAMGLNKARDWMKSGRQDNEFQANVASQRAKELGGVDSFRDVEGISSGLNYLGGLGAQSLPYLGEAVAGGLVTRGLSSGLRAATSAGRAAEATPEVMQAGLAAKKTLDRRALVGGVAASYPSSVGDILSNQRDQLRSNGLDDGQTDLLSAGLGGVAYAGLNALSPSERLLTQGGIGRGIGALDKMQGLKGGLARTGMNATGAGLLEGANETGQEFVNQGFGRMAVDPNETFFNPESNSRFGESFVGGAAMGGVLGGGAGGWRRSNGYVAKQAEEGRTADLLSQQQATQLAQDQQQQGLRTSGVRQQYEQQLQDLAGEEQGGYEGTAQDAWQIHQRQQQALRDAELLKQSRAVVQNDQFQDELQPAQTAVADAQAAQQNQQQAQQQQADQQKATEDARQAMLESVKAKYGAPELIDPAAESPKHNWMGNSFSGVDSKQVPFIDLALDRQAKADAKRMSTYGMPVEVADQLERLYAESYREQQQERSDGIKTKESPKDHPQAVKPSLFGNDFRMLVGGAASLADVAQNVQIQLDKLESIADRVPSAGAKATILQKFSDKLQQAISPGSVQRPAAPKAPAATASLATNSTPAASTQSAPMGVTPVVQPAAPVTQAPTVEPKLVGGVAVQELPYIAPSAKEGTNAASPEQIRSAKDNILRVLTMVEPRTKYAKEHAKTQQIIQDITGLQLDTNEKGEQILRQVDNPISMAEYADKVGVSREAISKRLRSRGITDENIDLAVGGFNAPTAQAVAASINGTEDVGYGGTDRADMAGVEVDEDSARVGEWTTDREAAVTQGRVENSLAKATGEGLVSDGEQLTPAQRLIVNRAIKYVLGAGDLNAALKEVLQPYEELIAKAHKDKDNDALVYPIRIKKTILIESAEAIEKRKTRGRRGDAATETPADKALREARHQESMQRAFAAWKSIDGVNFAKDWDYYRSRNLPSFVDLPESVQETWLKTAYNLSEDEQNDPRAVERAQRSVERDAADLLPTRAPDAQTDVVPGQSDDQTAPGYVGPAAAPTVTIKRKVRVPQQVQAPAAQGPDEQGRQALDPEVRAQVRALQTNVDHFKMLLACLRR